MFKHVLIWTWLQDKVLNGGLGRLQRLPQSTQMRSWKPTDQFHHGLMMRKVQKFICQYYLSISHFKTLWVGTRKDNSEHLHKAPCWVSQYQSLILISSNLPSDFPLEMLALTLMCCVHTVVGLHTFSHPCTSMPACLCVGWRALSMSHQTAAGISKHSSLSWLRAS